MKSSIFSQMNLIMRSKMQTPTKEKATKGYWTDIQTKKTIAAMRTTWSIAIIMLFE